MYTLHPATVHLPIGLLIGNAVLTMLYVWRGDRTVEVAAYHCLWLGILFMLPAVATGTYEAVRHLFDPANQRSDTLGWINAHALLGLTALVVYWQAWQQRRRKPNLLAEAGRRSYLATLAFGVLLLVAGGWVGGHMVYQLGVGVR